MRGVSQTIVDVAFPVASIPRLLLPHAQRVPLSSRAKAVFSATASCLKFLPVTVFCGFGMVLFGPGPSAKS